MRPLRAYPPWRIARPIRSNGCIPNSPFEGLDWRCNAIEPYDYRLLVGDNFLIGSQQAQILCETLQFNVSRDHLLFGEIVNVVFAK
jgi:hypothetical protein